MYDITPIIEAVAALIGVIVTCVLIPFIKSKTTASQQAETTPGSKSPSPLLSRFSRAAGTEKRRSSTLLPG